MNNQRTAILIDGNNVEMAIHKAYKSRSLMLDFTTYIPKILNGRSLTKLFYFREGTSVSDKLTQRLKTEFYGIVIPCGKSADVQLVMKAVQIVDKVDTVIILSGDGDFMELMKYLQYRGIRVEIASVDGASLNKKLRAQADDFHVIDAGNCFSAGKVSVAANHQEQKEKTI